MTVSSTTVKNSYSGNGSNDTFVYGFKIFADTDLEVIIRSATGTETIKTLTTHYTVTNAGSASGGNVVFTSGNIPTATETVVVRREVPQTQAIDYIANDPFPAESHEEGLDRATMTIQQLQEEVNRSIKLSATNTMTSTEFTVGATDRANKVLSFDASGEIAIAQELGTFKGSSATTTTAAYAVRDLVKGSTTAQLNNIYICIQASPVGTALTNTSYWVLIVDAVSAAASETAAETAEANAETAQAAAETARDASVVAKDASIAAKDLSVTAKNEAATSATAAAASADAFDDIYLGTKSSDPSTDNDGDALAAGMLYFNSTNDILRVYSGSAWQDAAISTTGVVTLTGTQTLTNKTLTSPKINENVAVTSTATELNLLDGKAATNLALVGKQEGTNFTNSLLVGHATTGTLNAASSNTGVGIEALDALTSGDSNTAIGYQSGTKITTGGNNTAIGETSLFTNTSGGSNTAMGHQSLYSLSNGSDNTAVGRVALSSVNSGGLNVGIGKSAGANITSGSGNVIIGGNTNADSATGARQLKISGNDGSTATTWISGDSSGNVSVPANLNLSGSNKELRFYEGANYVGFEAPALSADKIWVLPAADGSANQVLKTDGSGNLGFASAGGTNTPFFEVKKDSDQTISNASSTKITFESTVTESSSNVFDLTNNKFTVATAGNYLVMPGITFFDAEDNIERADMYVYKNNGLYKKFTHYNKAAGFREANLGHSFIMSLSVSDYLEMYVYVVTSDSGSLVAESDHKQTYFAATKLIT